jgi:6-phosphofructokinase
LELLGVLRCLFGIVQGGVDFDQLLVELSQPLGVSRVTGIVRTPSIAPNDLAAAIFSAARNDRSKLCHSQRSRESLRHVFCTRLAHNAVHAAMSGRTRMVVNRWHTRFVHVPMSLAIRERNCVDPMVISG